ncbi:zinc finger, RING/FYVE/PHD-type, ElonginA binding-protein 1 [Artemisia annua]|uniref:Zinc finger, RING/FYVE/PHD-type, ElonginA binding-protein 1 n=1 Tax=Artemisia annua TaxID=35608 RepID=A0A2U1KX82_ARTAN|nr:zinc finger, RING/FYVE/PHD-type, ElonginA binding-protein 1 [Artemisia annua]
MKIGGARDESVKIESMKVLENVVLEGDEGQRCGICMDGVVDRGVLDCCQHCSLVMKVYDTIGGVQPDDGSARDDDDEDWSVEGDNNTLSFPSYYIDENAVSCLEGDNCKIRSQSANIEEDPDLDTSIACDSCDLWYHAICVGFNADGSCETSWLCPRCLLDEASQKSEMGPNNLHGSESSSHEHLGDATFPMNMSVSVADAGETAVVVSNINGNQQTEVPYENSILTVNTNQDLKIGNQEDEERNQIVMPDSDVCAEMGIYNTSGDDNCKLEEQLAEKVIEEPKIEAMELDSCLSQGTSTLVSESSQLFESSGTFREETSASDRSKTSELYEENSTLESGKDDPTAEVIKEKVSKVRRLPAAKNSDKKEKAGGITCAKRKQRDCSAEELEPKTKMQNTLSAKSAKTERRNRVAHSINEPQESVPNDSSNSNKCIVKKRNVVTDIRDIVQGTHNRPSKRLAPEETSSGLRIKKIMRRTTDNKDSLVQVQSLRKEIREAIRNRSSKESGNNIFDPKLLAAFRAALAGQTTETRPQPVDVKAKKALMQKGTVRENLTKKIYASGGKRKRAWTRDCEIEFWKHRCSKVSKPEKIETLKSVLDLLRKGPTEVKEIKKENTLEAGNSILSRLYVADASVFPRNADIKPLSVQPNDSLVDSKVTKVAVPCNNSGPAPRKVNPNKSSDQSSRSTGGSLVKTQKESGNGNDVKFDKKKWALEVLARKTAVAGNNSSQGQDNAVLKGNYPLLAKLPVEMRPSLAPSRHNKIPISVRQAQLYRLTEHFLKKTNMPVTRPTAEIELAIADAINVEKAVADRSNSKLVYVNLCAQELLHRSDNRDSSTAPESEPKPDPETVKGDDIPTSADIDVDEALRNAGLLSDSPPASPNQYETDDSKEQDGPDNVFEIDPQPELDIYGDFEYDLEDDDFIGANPIKTTKPQQDDTKIKMVFSTLDFDKSDSAWRLEDHEAPVVMENANEHNKKEKSSLLEGGENENLDECEDIYGPDKEPLINKYPDLKLPDLITENNVAEVKDDQGSNLAAKACALPNGNCSENLTDLSSKSVERLEKKEKKPHADKKQQSDKRSSVFKKVEAYIKEHIRPLCKSGVITVEQYRWAVGKTTDKIMKYHSKDTNANFLIKEGEKVKKLAEQYVETAQKVENNK